jgi:hypothetical protein
MTTGNNDDASRLFPGYLDEPVIDHDSFIPATCIDAGAMAARGQNVSAVLHARAVCGNGGDAIGPLAIRGDPAIIDDGRRAPFVMMARLRSGENAMRAIGRGDDGTLIGVQHMGAALVRENGYAVMEIAAIGPAMMAFIVEAGITCNDGTIVPRFKIVLARHQNAGIIQRMAGCPVSRVDAGT